MNLKSFTLSDLIRGAILTFRYFFQDIVTVQYPKERRVMTPRFRGTMVLPYDEENDRPKCIACGICVRNCPTNCITLEASTEKKGKFKYPVQFEIDLMRCTFCGYCQETCPHKALLMTDNYELAVYTREEAVLNLDTMIRRGENG